jgi:hypothetical protein
MSITFKRPMFRMGGQARSEDTGITSGLRQPYQVGRLVTDESGSYENYPYGVSPSPDLMGIGAAANTLGLLNSFSKANPASSFFPKLDQEGKAEPVSIEDKLSRIQKQYEVTPADDFNALIEGVGQGFTGAYTLGEALNKSAQARRQIIDPRVQRAQEVKTKLELLPLEQQFQRELKGMESKGQIQFKERIIDNYIDALKEQAKTPAEKTAIENNRTLLKFQYIAQGADISDLLRLSASPEIISNAKTIARNELKAKGIQTSDPNYGKLLKDLTDKYTAESVLSIKERVGGDLFRTEKAEGGMINNTTQPIEQQDQTKMKISPPTTENVQMLSYGELRNRLPKEISNDIIKLLSISYQALGDFAEIATQSDVDKFNLKYGVSLALPRGE